jgi:hypothetical protein
VGRQVVALVDSLRSSLEVWMGWKKTFLGMNLVVVGGLDIKGRCRRGFGSGQGFFYLDFCRD